MLNGVAMKADVLQLRVGQSGAMKNQGTHDMVGRIEFGGRTKGCSAQYHPRNWNTIYTKKDQQQLKENQTDISKTMNLANPDTQKKQSKDESFQCRLGNCEICQNRQ